MEHRQMAIYLLALILGMSLGSEPGFRAMAAFALWPALASLLFVTFLQIPLFRLKAAITDLRFLGSMMLGEALLMPLLVAALLELLPAEPGLRLGVALVLLAPCTDWFVSFSLLGRGDSTRALAATPLRLLLQIVSVPLWLALLVPGELASLELGRLAPAVLLIAVPLVLAVVFERVPKAMRDPLREGTQRLMVPLLAAVILFVAGAQPLALDELAGWLPSLLGVFAAYLILAAFLARLLAALFRLPPAQGRTLAYGFGTRNSFVVLPIALVLPEPLSIAAMVIVLQALVELLGMLVYLAALARLFPDRNEIRVRAT